MWSWRRCAFLWWMSGCHVGPVDRGKGRRYERFGGLRMFFLMKTMTFRIVPCLVFFLTISCLLAEEGVEVLNPSQAALAVGKDVVMTGVVDEVVERETGTVFWNFGGKYPANVFAVVILPEIRDRFADLESIEGKKVRISGRVVDHKGRPRIILRERSQVEVE